MHEKQLIINEIWWEPDAPDDDGMACKVGAIFEPLALLAFFRSKKWVEHARGDHRLFITDHEAFRMVDSQETPASENTSGP